MKGKEALKIIVARLSEGKSRQELFTELSPQITNTSVLIQYIAMVPDRDGRLKYRLLNILLLVALIYITLLSSIPALTSILLHTQLASLIIDVLFPIISFLFIVKVLAFKGYVYRHMTLFYATMILYYITHPHHGLDRYDEIFTFYLPLALICLISFIIGSRLFPYYSFFGKLDQDKAKTSFQITM